MTRITGIKKDFPVLMIIAAGLCIGAGSAFGGIAVSPMQQWVTVKPGQESSFVVTVTSTLREAQSSSQTLAVEAVDFEIAPEGGISFGKEFSHSRSALKLISVGEGDGQFVLEPGQSRQIKAKVSAPLSADGDYWGAILVRIANPQKDAKGITVNLQTASGIFIHVPRKNSTERGCVIRTDVNMPNIAAATANQNGEESEEAGLRVTAELKNEGVVTFLGEGQAYLYTDKMKRCASMPMHASRRQIFPGQSRIFAGVLKDAVSAGSYKMRVAFNAVSQNNDSDSGGQGRTIIKDLDFTISPEVARQWSEKIGADKPEQLKVRPEEIKLTAAAGRFTSVSVLVENAGISTVKVKSLFGQSPIKNWFSSESDITTFGPNMKRNIVFSLSIPKDTESGQYSGTLVLEIQRSGVDGKDAIKEMTVPISIKVT